MKNILIAFLCFFMISCTAKNTVEVKPSKPNIELVKLSADTDGLYIIKGQIDQDVYDKFLKNFKSIKILVLDSKGGIYEYTKTMAAVLRRIQVTTIVPNGATCESACTLLFQSGMERIVGIDAKFMYHGLRYSSGFMNSYLTECPIYTHECEDRFEFMKLYISKLTLEYFFLNEYYGADRYIFKKFKTQWIDQNWLNDGNLVGHRDLWISPEDALKYKVATSIKDISIY